MTIAARLITPLALAAPALAGTLTVGPLGSGAAFLDIQAAIDAAAPGDVVLVEPGSYSRFRVTKGVRIVATIAGAVEVRQGGTHPDFVCAEVTDVPAGQVAEISGIFFLADLNETGPFPNRFPPAVSLRDSAGLVSLHEVAIQPGHAIAGSGDVGPGLTVRDCAIVQLHGVVVDAPVAFLGAGDAAVEVEGSEVWIQGCALRGSSSQTLGVLFPPKDAHPALEATRSIVYAARSTFTGGSGGYTLVPDPFGGVDLHVHYHAPAVRVMGDSLLELAGGPGSDFTMGSLVVGGPVQSSSGTPPLGAVEVHGTGLVAYTEQIPMDPPLPGGLFVAPTATAVSVTFAYPTLGAVTGTVLPGGAITLDLAGNPGALGTLYGAGAPAPPLGLPSIDGAAGIDVATLLFLGTAALDLGGHAGVVLPVPPNPALVGKALVAQWLESGGPRPALSNPAQVFVRP